MSIATNLSKLETDISNAYSAINTKGGTIPQNKNTNNLATAITSIPSGGGIEIQGIIEQYKVLAGDNISAGDFVRFINEMADAGNDTAISNSTSGYTGYTISAILLSENKVFIAHSYSTSYYLYGVVCEINGTTIIAGTDTAINSSIKSTGRTISAVLLSENRVFIAHSYNSSSYFLYGIICEINGTTITQGTDTAISSANYTGYTISAVKLDENRVFIAHSYNSSNYYLYGIVCTISGTTITTGTDTAINSSIARIGNTISAVKLSENKVFIAHSYSSSYYLYGIVCTISGTTITKGTDTQLSDSTARIGYVISAILLSENKVFIAHSYNSSNYYLYGIVCTISGTTITQGTDTAISSTNYTGYTISAVLLSENKVFIAHSKGSSSTRYLYGIICEISGTTIIAENDTAINNSTNYTGYAISAVMLEDEIFIAHNYSDDHFYLYGIAYLLDHYVATLTSANDRIFGIAGEDGEYGDTIDVYVPDFT